MPQGKNRITEEKHSKSAKDATFCTLGRPRNAPQSGHEGLFWQAHYKKYISMLLKGSGPAPPFFSNAILFSRKSGGSRPGTYWNHYRVEKFFLKCLNYKKKNAISWCHNIFITCSSKVFRNNIKGILRTPENLMEFEWVFVDLSRRIFALNPSNLHVNVCVCVGRDVPDVSRKMHRRHIGAVPDQGHF